MDFVLAKFCTKMVKLSFIDVFFDKNWINFNFFQFLLYPENDMSGSGADSSLKKKKVVTEDDKEREQKRIESLIPKAPPEKARKPRPNKPKVNNEKKEEEVGGRHGDKKLGRSKNKSVGKKRTDPPNRKTAPAKRRKQ
jgi:hypothetical protein